MTSCGVVQKIEKQTKVTGESKPKVSSMNFETKSISEIRNSAEKSMSVLGTDSSEYGNIAKTGIVPIITDKDEIYSIRPSYDRVVFTGTFVLNNGIPINTAPDFRGGNQ